MKETIEGKVAAIINDKIIVINRGEKDGVNEDMTFAIFVLGEELTDSKTGESLGNFEHVKAKVSVIHVQEKMCSTIQIPETDMGDLVQVEAIEKGSESNDSKVVIGDLAREYVGMPQLLEFARLLIK